MRYEPTLDIFKKKGVLYVFKNNDSNFSNHFNSSNYRYIQSMGFRKGTLVKMEKKPIKYFSDLEYDKAYAYNFYIAPRAYELLKTLHSEHGLAISKTINLAILEYYKKVVSQK